MCNLLLLPLVKKFKNQDMSSFVAIYDSFKKLISFYAMKLNFEDAESELILFFIELLYSLELKNFAYDSSESLKKYIAVCIRNHYIALSVKNTKYTNSNCELYENSGFCTYPYDERVIVEQLFDFLSEKQKTVLIYRYIYGYSDCEIARKLNIKRQAVNRLKNRAFKVLRANI